MAAALFITLPGGMALAAPDCTDPKHADKPVCTGDNGGGDGGGGGEIATNDVQARWAGAGGVGVDGTGVTPRDCHVEGNPKPNGTHIPYACEQAGTHTISVNLTGGVAIGGKGNPSPADQATCNAGFAFVAYPNTQYIMGPISGEEVCTDAGGCELQVLNSIFDQRAATGWDFVKLTGVGRIPQSDTLNPFACPGDGSAPVTASYNIDSVEVGLRNGNGSKADLVCLFDANAVGNQTGYEVTPVCP